MGLESLSAGSEQAIAQYTANFARSARLVCLT